METREDSWARQKTSLFLLSPAARPTNSRWSWWCRLKALGSPTRCVAAGEYSSHAVGRVGEQKAAAVVDAALVVSNNVTIGRSGRARVVFAAFALVVPASCQSSGASAPPAEEADFVLVGSRLVFSPTTLDVPVGKDLVIRFDNRERGVAHNLRFKTVPGDPRTKLEKGPIVQDLNVRFDEPGKYRYTCDIHPLMNGVATAS